MATVNILYFASIREAIGCDGERRELPAHVTTPRLMTQWLSESGEAYGAAFADLGRLRVAIDQRLSDFDASLDGASEIAFFPPVTGG